MKFNIYQENGYIDIESIIKISKEYKCPFIYVWGGRGTGKTFNSLAYAIENDMKVIYVRRTQTQLDALKSERLNPIGKLNKEKGWFLKMDTLAKNVYGIFGDPVNPDPEDTTYMGAMIALSTYANVRGFDSPDCKMIIYDEFIKDPTERPFRGSELDALSNLYETINRNREIDDGMGIEDPVLMLCLANSNECANPIFLELGVVSKAVNMQKTGQIISILKDRRMILIHLEDSDISKKKENTALYQMRAGSDFATMALKNDFKDVNEFSGCSRPLKEYKPVLSIGEITIYKHKSNGYYYVSTHKQGAPRILENTQKGIRQFQAEYSWLWPMLIDGRLEVESFVAEAILTQYLFKK